MNKKGAELSMNVIIIAAIALIVLVILAVLVLRAGGTVKTGTESCLAKGGSCQLPVNCDSERRITSTTDCNANTDGKTMCCRVV